MSTRRAGTPPLLEEEPGVRGIGYREQLIGQNKRPWIVGLCQPGDRQTAPGGTTE